MNDKTEKQSFGTVRDTLKARLSEDGPGYIQIITGPRQVGKTTILREMEKGRKWHGIYAAADAPDAALRAWWDALLDEVQVAAARKKTVLLIDEVQYLPDWSRLVKAAYDSFTRHNLPIRMVLSGSSSLQVGKGARETMAGRFERLHLSHWPAMELVRQFKMSKEEAVSLYVKRGICPGAISFKDDESRWIDYVRDSIVEPAVGRDILAVENIRKPALLRQILAIAAGHPSEIVSLQKIRGQLTDCGALETVAHYLHSLEQAYLVCALPKYSAKMLRQRAAPPKLLVLSQAIIRAASRRLDAPSPSGEYWGRLVENACGAYAWNAGQQVWYWREEPLEVDFVFEGTWGSWAVEVKTGAYTLKDLHGLLEFCRRYRAFRPLLLCDRQHTALAADMPIAVRPWRDYLLSGPPE